MKSPAVPGRAELQRPAAARVAALSLVVAALCVVPAVQAEPAERQELRVVLLSHCAGSEAEHRLGAELRAMGLEVVLAEAGSQELPALSDEIAAQARERGAVAGVSLFGAADAWSVVVWVGGDVGEILVERHLGGAQADEGGAVQVALFTAELLHASLLEARLVGEAGREMPPADQPGSPGAPAAPGSPVEGREALPLAAEAPSPPPAPAPARSTVLAPPAPRSEGRQGSRRPVLRRGRLRASVGATLPFDPPSAMVSALLGGGLRLLPWLTLDADLAVTPSPYLTEGQLGWSEQYTGALRAGVTFEPWASRRVGAGFGLGGGVLLVWASGEALDGSYSGTVDLTAVGVVSTTIGLRVALSARWRLLAQATLSFALPPVSVRHGGETVATLGLPLLDLSLGVELELGDRLENR